MLFPCLGELLSVETPTESHAADQSNLFLPTKTFWSIMDWE
jgi:hypothetical protein